MIGAGAQAMDQVMAVACVRQISDVRVWSRTSAARDALRLRLSESLPKAVIGEVADANVAVDGAHIVTCATPSTEPLFDGRTIGDDVHINAIGAFKPSMCELPASVLGRARIIAIDNHAAAKEEAGDLLRAINSGALAAERLVELGSLLEYREASWRHGFQVGRDRGARLGDRQPRLVASQPDLRFVTSMTAADGSSSLVGAAFAERIMSEYARATRTHESIPISSAHVDSCLYQGQSSLDFARRLVAGVLE